MRTLTLTLAAVLVTLIALPSRAHAAGGTGYVCNVAMFPSSSSFGNSGYVSYELYSGPSCSGSYLGINLVCSVGATTGYSSQCSSYLFSEAGLIAEFGALRAAASTNQKVFVGVNPFQSPNAANPPNFYAGGY
jgi:hypothetical protein